MTYFGQKVRSCLIHADDIELQLLKLYIRRAVENQRAVSYKNKLFLVPSHRNGPIQIVRLSEPDVAIEIPTRRTPDAVDRFIDAFVFETDVSLDNVMFHKSNDINSDAETWKSILYFQPILSYLITGTEPKK